MADEALPTLILCPRATVGGWIVVWSVVWPDGRESAPRCVAHSSLLVCVLRVGEAFQRLKPWLP